MNLGSIPRVKLANLPTPLQKLTNLSKELGGPTIYIKRDDLTGLAFGGNKARKLEYLMGEAQNQNADYIVTGAGYQSNWCTQTAAASKKLGMDIVLIKKGPYEDYEGEDWDGNHLLHRLYGAEIKVVESESYETAVEETMQTLKNKGHKPYYIPIGGSTPLGAAGYLNAILELTYQATRMNTKLDYLVHGTGSGGTLAGSILGAKTFNPGMHVLGIAVDEKTVESHVKKVKKIIDESIEYYQLSYKPKLDDIQIISGYARDGYGYVTKQKIDAVKILAETEGVCIDPVYTGTAMAGLIDLIKNGKFNKRDNIVFIHTGGAVALFPYKEPIKAHLSKSQFPWEKPQWSTSTGI